jgi:PfaD family protein
LDLTLPLVYFRVKGIHQDAQGNIVCPNKVIAKVSRVEVAAKFFSPPPDKLLAQLLDKKMISPEEASLAKHISLAEDLSAEADSGGHTDNRPAISLLPTMIALRDRMAEKYHYKKPPCVGLGGGVSTPESAAAAFAMGAAYILTGSVNQSCVEAGTSEAVRHLLAEARQADVTMAPAADMFELGVKVQVLKRGTMFPLRAAKLYELYCRYDRLEAIPPDQRKILERDFFRCSLEEEWLNTRKFFAANDPRQITRAESDPRHKMALVFRSYLGQSSRWAVRGEPSRKIDYQIWCGPSLGAFNEWVSGTFLEKPENRKTVTVAMNLLAGAAVVTRANWLRCQGVILPSGTGTFPPTELSTLYELIGDK